jgi:hypothetical protein
MTPLDDATLAEIRRREEWFFRPDVRESRAELDAVVGDDFLEIGRSGRLYDKAAAVATLVAEPEAGAVTREYSIAEIQGRWLAPELAQVVFRLLVVLGGQGPAHESMRTSIWARREGGWQIVYHQGTARPAA